MDIKKCVILREHALKENIHLEQVITVGNGEYDLEIPSCAGLGISF